MNPRSKKEWYKWDEPTMSVEEYDRAQHSKILAKLHKEVQPHLKDIWTKLNALDLDCQLPKSKNRGSNAKCAIEEPNNQPLPKYGIGGKVGKPYFMVQVGEVQNLHKTTKSSSLLALQQNQSGVPTLDLHGGTRGEAIVRLNESLEVWVDTTMRGYNPFVITAVILFGCGSQVLSETVQEWINLTSRVCNALKNHLI